VRERFGFTMQPTGLRVLVRARSLSFPETLCALEESSGPVLRFLGAAAFQEIDLADPNAGEVLMRLVGCGVWHADLYTASGPTRPAVVGTSARGSWEPVGDCLKDVCARRHVLTPCSLPSRASRARSPRCPA
jgi:hypothetical protein